jgi:hypothetical protein
MVGGWRKGPGACCFFASERERGEEEAEGPCLSKAETVNQVPSVNLRSICSFVLLIPLLLLCLIRFSRSQSAGDRPI